MKDKRRRGRPVGNEGQHYTDTHTGSSGDSFTFFFGYDEARGFFGERAGRAYTRARTQEQARRRAPSFPPRTRRTCPHSVLGVECGASPKDLRAAYRALAKTAHPDLGPAGERGLREKAMKRINRAYEAAAQELQ